VWHVERDGHLLKTQYVQENQWLDRYAWHKNILAGGKLKLYHSASSGRWHIFFFFFFHEGKKKSTIILDTSSYKSTPNYIISKNSSQE